jgi:predicted RNA-binding Zn ribbon-like protein
MLTENPLAALSLVGGRLCLDFTNTVSFHRPPWGNERLRRYEDLVWWALRAGLVSEPAAERLFARAEAEPEEAARVFARAVELREAMYRVFAAAGADEPAAAGDLETVNGELARAMPRLRVAPEGEGYGWAWEEGDALDRMLWPVARSAAELLTSSELKRVGGCCDEECDWLYLDTSRNHSRRWCDMKDCGNRAKARRHYRRTKQTTET